MSITVGPFTGSAGEWDDFVRRQAGWSHFHLYGWRRVYEEVFEHECLWLGARHSSLGLVGVLPLVRVKSLLFGHYLVSLPYVNYGGPLGTADAVRALAIWAVERAKQDGVKLLELRSREELPIDLPVSHRKITVVLDLPGSPEALMKSFESKLRSQVRRPAKEGVTYRFGPEQAGPFFEVFARHMRDLGTPTQPRQLFEVIAETFPDAWFGTAWLGERPIAGGAGFRWGSEFEMTWASSLYSHQKIAANMGLYFAFMERAIGAGLTLFNFGRCTPGAGTHRFKKQWGSRDEPLWWYQAGRGAEGNGAGATPSPEQGAYSWGPRVWQKLPLRVATALGPRIVRGIP